MNYQFLDRAATALLISASSKPNFDHEELDAWMVEKGVLEKRNPSAYFSAVFPDALEKGRFDKTNHREKTKEPVEKKYYNCQELYDFAAKKGINDRGVNCFIECFVAEAKWVNKVDDDKLVEFIKSVIEWMSRRVEQSVDVLIKAVSNSKYVKENDIDMLAVGVDYERSMELEREFLELCKESEGK